MSALLAPVEPTYALRPYQDECVRSVLAARDRGVQRILGVAATGAGKTIMFCHLAQRLGCRTLVLAHRDELIEQAAEKLQAVLGTTATVGIVKANRNEITADVLVGSIQTVSRPKRVAQMPRDLGLVIADEAHHTRAGTWRYALEKLGCWDEDGPTLLGVTATPDRGDGKTIGHTIFQEQVFQVTTLDLIEQGYLSDVRAIRVDLAVDLSSVRVSHGDYRADDLSEALMGSDAPTYILDAYREHGEGRKALCFVPSVAMAYAVADTLDKAGVPSEGIDGTLDTDARRAVLARFRSGQTRVVVNCALLTEGFDEPSIECLLLCRPTKSRPLFVQMLGRGLRSYPGKPDCLVIDFSGGAGKHDVATVPDVFALKDREVAGGVKAAVAARAATAREREAMILGAEARHMDLFGHGRGLHWIDVPDTQALVLSLGSGKGLLKLRHLQDGWILVRDLPSDARGVQWQRQIIARGLQDAEARVQAERVARQVGDAWLMRDGASWRSGEPSERQQWYARAQGVMPSDGMTAGELSDLITLAQATRSMGRVTR